MNVKGNKKKIERRRNFRYTLFALPALIYLLLFNYLPMSGIVVAFKDYKHVDGIWGSAWVGLKNFEFFFQSSDAWRILRNTIGYSLAILICLNLVGGMIVAILLYEVRNRFANKFYQTAMLLPDFVSWVVISFIAYLFLNPTNTGILNRLLTSLGLDAINWYNEPKYWPFIIVFFQMWKAVGMAALYYYAALLNVDPSLYEAAVMDGASKFRQIWHISVPELMPMACLVLITQLGGILGGSFDMFYQLPMNSGALYPTTDVISTYVYRGLTSGTVGVSAAIGLIQGVVGLVLVIITNTIIKKVQPENAMF